MIGQIVKVVRVDNPRINIVAEIHIGQTGIVIGKSKLYKGMFDVMFNGGQVATYKPGELEAAEAGGRG